MRIGTRLWIFLVLTIAIVLGAGTALRAMEERSTLSEALLRDRTFLGESLAASFRHLTTEQMLQAVKDLLADPRMRDSHVTARLVEVGKDVPKERAARLNGDALKQLLDDQPVARFGPDSIITYAPLRGPNGKTLATWYMQRIWVRRSQLQAKVSRDRRASVARCSCGMRRNATTGRPPEAHSTPVRR